MAEPVAITWRELTQRVEAAGLVDAPIGYVNLRVDDGFEPLEDALDIEIFRNIEGTITVANCGDEDRPRGGKRRG